MTTKAKIENIVSAITLNAKIDLKRLVSSVRGIEYNPENFPGAILRLQEPRVTILVFSTGKAVCTGARSREDIDLAVKQLVKKLGEGGVKVTGEPDVKIQNIVASSSIDAKINLDQLAIESYNTEYEPEQFPGLVYRLDDPKTVLLIFSTGKMIVTGAKDPKDVQTAADKAERMIRGHKNAIL